MTMRNQPTARQVRLGTELRRLREAAGKSAREVAGLLGSSSTHMSQIEAGSSGISEERLRRLAAHCTCTDQELIEALVGMAADRTRGWWEEYRGVLPTPFSTCPSSTITRRSGTTWPSSTFRDFSRRRTTRAPSSPTWHRSCLGARSTLG